MPKLTDKRVRLRAELQAAYGEWLRVSSPMEAAAQVASDGERGPPATRQWIAYLEAKKRLVAAYAERPVAA